MHKRPVYPVIVLNEEAQETANKDSKNYWLNHPRKSGHRETNEDVSPYFDAASDPLITFTATELEEEERRKGVARSSCPSFWHLQI